MLIIAGTAIAAGPGGHLVAVSDDAGLVWYYDRVQNAWREDKLPGGVQDVIANLRLPGRFWLCKKEQGLWRSDGGGRTWKCVSKHDAWHAAVDWRAFCTRDS